MARIWAILAALMTAVRRDFKTLGSVSGNNLFVAGVAFLFLGDPGVFVALSAFIGLVLFIPLSADPLRALPNDRLEPEILYAAARFPLGESRFRRFLQFLVRLIHIPPMWAR